MLGKICPRFSVIPPPHRMGTEMRDTPYLKGSGFHDPPHFAGRKPCCEGPIESQFDNPPHFIHIYLSSVMYSLVWSVYRIFARQLYKPCCNNLVHNNYSF